LSLALDSNNIPYILYASDSLKLAVYHISSWDIQTVVPNLHGPDNFGNMVLDSKDYPHFIYREFYGVPSNDTLVYASWDGARWTTQTVVSNDQLTYTGFLALDSHDYPNISYIASYQKQLMYARWTGKEWNSQIVGTNVTADAQCYLAVDTDNNPHISYRLLDGQIYSSYHSHIIYATAILPSVTEPIEPFPTIWILGILGIIIIIGVTLLVFFKQTKKSKDNPNDPEFPSWIILPLFLTATLVIVIFRKSFKKRVKSGNYL